MTTATPTISGGLLVKEQTKGEDLKPGMYWHPDRMSWPHRIATVKVSRVNVKITDEYGTEKSFKRTQKVPTAVVIGDMPEGC